MRPEFSDAGDCAVASSPRAMPLGARLPETEALFMVCICRDRHMHLDVSLRLVGTAPMFDVFDRRDDGLRGRLARSQSLASPRSTVDPNGGGDIQEADLSIE